MCSENFKADFLKIPASFLKKVQFCLQRAEIKNENVDCEVYKKPDVMKFTPQDTGKLPRSNHYDLLDMQYLHLT